jgi:pentatricopeptide repeat protein
MNMSSSSRKLSRLFNIVTQNQKSPVLLSSDQEAARRITACLVEKSTIGKLQSNPSLLFNLNSNVTRLVLSEPTLPTQSCIDFFKLLREFESNLKPDLTAVVTLSHRLYSNRRFNEMRSLLNSVVNDGFYKRPVEELGSAMVDCDISEEKFEFFEKFFDLVFRVYVDNGMFEEGLRVFDYMVKKGLSIDERSCIVFLVAAKKRRRIDLCLEIFRRMVDSGVKITVYSLTIVVEGLCRRGEVEKKRFLGCGRGFEGDEEGWCGV